MKAMILAAGRGKRMGSLTSKLPKPLIQVNQKTLIDHQIFKLRKAGISEIVINVSWLGSQIIDHVSNKASYGIKISFLDAGKNMLGTGGGIYNALQLLGQEPFWLVNADVYSDYEIDSTKQLKSNSLAHLILVYKPSHHPDGDFFIKDGFVHAHQATNPYTFSGMSIISPEIFKGSSDKVFALEPLLVVNASMNRITGEYFNGNWIDVGSPERLADIESSLK